MKAAIFIRRNGAGGLGHVGWAFEYDDGTHNAGAVENPPGVPLTSPDEMGFWSIKTNNPVQPMKGRDYDGYKIIDIPHGNQAKAWSTVLWVKKQWYTLLFGNCMDDVYNILTAYGLSLPLPGEKITPNNWFDSLNWSYYTINQKLANNVDVLTDLHYSASEYNIDELLIADIKLAVKPDWIKP